MSSPAAMPSKEELLIMMDKVDRDIAAVETQISALQKKQVSKLVIVVPQFLLSRFSSFISIGCLF